MKNTVNVINHPGWLTVEFIDKFGRVFESRNFDADTANEMFRNIYSWGRHGWIYKKGA